jgi:aminopeptidase N
VKVVDPHSYADLEQGRITHMDLALVVDFSSRTLRGEARYELDRACYGSLFLDTRAPNLERIHSEDQGLAWELDRSDPVLGQRLHLKDLDEVSRFSIQFATGVEASALQWLAPEQTTGGQHPFLFSQCQPIHARSIFPCQDTPAVRFTYTAEVQVPAPLVAIMAAAPIDVLSEGGINTCSFDMPQAIPSYLFAMAVGNLVGRDLGPRCRVYAEPETVEAAAWEFADTEGQLKAAEALFGPYAWERYDMLVMPPSFPYGGMENPRLTFLTPTLLTGDRSRIDIIAHELAHSWTGNLVTNATWQDFWLNEGWTTYAQARIDEVLQGRDQAQLLAAIERQRMLEEMRLFGMDSDLTRLKYSMQGLDPDAVFSNIPYQKGYAFLVLLEQAVGRQAFDDFIQKYMATFRFQSLTTEEFIAFLERELPQAVAQVDLQEWLYGAGFPDSAPAIQSTMLDEIVARVKAYEGGGRPTREEVADWRPGQTHLFLRMLPDQIPADDCRHLWSVFGFEHSRHYDLLTVFFTIAIRSGYQDVFSGVEELVSRVGRAVYLKPIYRSMAQTEWTRPLVRSLFERCRAGYHSIAAAAIERILTEAGL